MATNLFQGFTPFADAPLPEGSVKIQYGLSVQVVRLAAEANVAPQVGVTPADLAEKYAAAFNMPRMGLIVYADGREIPFGEPIPAAARVLEFRQPAGEKGSDARLAWVTGPAEIVPLPATAATIEVSAFTPAETRYEIVWGPKAAREWANTQLRTVLKILTPVIGLEKGLIVRLGEEEVKPTSTKPVGREALSLVRRLDLPAEQKFLARLTTEAFVGKELAEILAGLPDTAGREWKGWIGKKAAKNGYQIQPGDYIVVAVLTPRS